MSTLQLAPEQATAQVQEQKTYYSTSISMMIHPSAGEQVVQNGRLVGTFGEVIEHFVPCGDYGVLHTDNPITIKWIEKQIAAGRGDMITAEEYNRRITSPDVHIARGQEKNRKLVEENEALLALVEQYRQRDLRGDEAAKPKAK